MKPRRNVHLLLAGALLLAACQNGGSVEERGSVDVSDGSAGERTIAGRVQAVVVGLACPLVEGSPVRVFDGSSRLVAQTSLPPPQIRAVGDVVRCAAPFRVAGVPDSASYTIRVANASATYSREDLVRLGWMVSLTAGQLV